MLRSGVTKVALALASTASLEADECASAVTRCGMGQDSLPIEVAIDLLVEFGDGYSSAGLPRIESPCSPDRTRPRPGRVADYHCSSEARHRLLRMPPACLARATRRVALAGASRAMICC